MALRYIGVDPETPNTGSPTVWVDEASGDLILQGLKIDDTETLDGIAATGQKWETIPAHETIMRMPARMIPILKDALGDS